MAKKIYVVWIGKDTGIFHEWKQCQASINGFKGAKYKGFKTIDAANKALLDGPDLHWGLETSVESEVSKEELEQIGQPIFPSMSVDAAWNTQTLIMEYQGVDTMTQKPIFHQGPFKDGTNNTGEFLALVHGLAHLKKENSEIPIYSDSENAIKWVREKQHRSKLKPNDNNKKLFELLDRAVKWLRENEYPNQIMKWETKAWGENPADFGRK